MSECNAALSECDEPADVFVKTWRTARQKHCCYECRDTIASGDRYEHVSMLWEGMWHTTKTCAACASIAEGLSPDGSRVTGILWDDVRENVFPEGTLAGCLARIDGVSAREKFTVEWRKWKGLEETP